MDVFVRIVLLCCALVALPSAYAKEAAEDTSHINATLKKHFPDLATVEVTPSAVSCLYQVIAGSSVFYVTKDARYLVSGDMIDLQKSQHNVTEDARKTARLAGLKALGNEHMILFSPKDPKYTINVFTDVDCGYCRKFQAEMGKINDLGIAVRYLAFPRSGPNTPTYEKMVKVWCAKDKKQAMNQASKDQEIKGEECSDKSVLKEFQFGVMAGVNGTPTIIFEDGSLFPGYLPPEKLLQVAKKVRQSQNK
jgi:thiol:disulfide interchange protein DsbC